MSNALPPRPNLDHLRKQAKALLAALEAGDPAAVATLREHLPAVKGLKADQIRAAKLRLADAQSAVARQSGFGGWPQLARHVGQLRALEGTWGFVSLEVEGNSVPAAAMADSRILIDGDRFRTESPEAIYEGVFNIDVEAQPHAIDIEFIAGPEAGNTNRGIFRLEAETLEICLDVSGKGRPAAFASAPGTHHARETLRRVSVVRPAGVTGGTPPPPTTNARAAGAGPAALEPHPPSATLDRLQGEWVAEKIVRDGQALPPFMLKTGSRSAKGDELKIAFGGQVMIHARVRIDDRADPVQVDYHLIGGACPGGLQLGIMRWEGQSAWFCMGAPGQARPADFDCPAGSGRTLSRWKLKK